jgi:acetyl esterase/lipase
MLGLRNARLERKSMKSRRKSLPLLALFIIWITGCQRAAEPIPELPVVSVEKPQASTGLLATRQGFQTQIIPSSYRPDGPADAPPPGLFRLVRYPSSAGPLAAYVTPDPGDGKKHAAVVWAHGGFGGIGGFFWEPAPAKNDQSARAFREAGCVLMCPSWRGENDNPGRFELFYGEVEDLLAARAYAAQLPYVDPERIYLGGHSTGGTLVLLAAVSTDQYRAAFSFGGAPDIERVVTNGKGYGNTPFDHRSKEECRLRSAIHFVGAIKRPTFYFEGESSSYNNEAALMKQQAQLAGVPFEAFMIRSGSHFTILDPITRLVARKILQDTGTTCNIQLTAAEVQEAFAGRRRE